MAQYYKKGSLGMMVKADGGASDPELAEVRLTADEYANMCRRIRAAERATKEAEAEGDRKADAAYESVNKQLAKYKAEADQRAERREQVAEQAKQVAEQAAEQAKRAAEQAKQDAEKKAANAMVAIQDMQSEVKRAIYLNSNLKRIARERANAARGITPKKEHDGYLVLNSRQHTEKYQEDVWDSEEHKKIYDKKEEDRATAKKCKYLKVIAKTADVWKSIVQTPYDSSLPFSQIRREVEDEIGSVLESINVGSRLKPEFNGTYYDFGKNEEGYEENGMYRWKFIANYCSGFWEMEIYTTKSLRVPEYRRPPMWSGKKN